MANPYEPALVGDSRRSILPAAAIAFATVFGISVLSGLFAPFIAHFVANAPQDFTMMVFRLSLGFVLPFGFVVAVVAALYATRKTELSRVLLFLCIYAVMVPLMLNRHTSGRLTDYTAIAYGITIASAVCVGCVLRRRLTCTKKDQNPVLHASSGGSSTLHN